jgi:hypothetical protein
LRRRENSLDRALAMGHEHKGYRIDVRSYRSPAGRWRPEIRLAVTYNGRLTERQLFTPPDRLFETEEQANQYGVDHAILWIDKHG